MGEADGSPEPVAAASRSQRMRLTPTRVPWAAVAAFVVLACGLAWLVCLPLWRHGGLSNPNANVVLYVMMYTPALAAVAVVLVVHKRGLPGAAGNVPVLEFLGLWPLRPASRTVWMTVTALVGTSLLIMIGVLGSAAFGRVHLDLVHFSSFAARLPPQARQVPIQLLVLGQIISIPVGSVVNAFLTLGEEVGWRGWLLPNLRPLGTWPALLCTGAIWGLWHAPIILLGYNFNRPDLRGVLLMIGGCTVFGVLIGWLRLRTASLWPCVFAHAALNATGGFVVLVMAAHTRTDPAATGPLGWVTWLVEAVLIGALVLTGQFRQQPSLGRSSARTGPREAR